ncbi:hypothetical protein QC760_000992 [Botrytis cinerea]
MENFLTKALSPTGARRLYWLAISPCTKQEFWDHINGIKLWSPEEPNSENLFYDIFSIEMYLKAVKPESKWVELPPEDFYIGIAHLFGKES